MPFLKMYKSKSFNKYAREFDVHFELSCIKVNLKKTTTMSSNHDSKSTNWNTSEWKVVIFSALVKEHDPKLLFIVLPSQISHKNKICLFLSIRLHDEVLMPALRNNPVGISLMWNVLINHNKENLHFLWSEWDRLNSRSVTDQSYTICTGKIHQRMGKISHRGAIFFDKLLQNVFDKSNSVPYGCLRIDITCSYM